MDITLKPPVKTGGEIKAICSKSQAHRALICAYLAKGKSKIYCPYLNADIKATADCLKNMGAQVCYENGYFEITPPECVYETAKIDCGESGSTLRFLLPVVSASGKYTEITMHGRLPERPIGDVVQQLEIYGIEFYGKNPLIVKNTLPQMCDFKIKANASSQFASGLLFNIGAFGGSVELIGKTESKPYIDMTVDMLKFFGAQIKCEDSKYICENAGTLKACDIEVEGDWSNAAFFVAAGVIGKGEIYISGLNSNSRQGDKAIVDILKAMGADIQFADNCVIARPSQLKGVEIDASDIPDLVPILSVCAANAQGVTKINGVKRLRLKESDRIKTVCDMIENLGGKITAKGDDCIEIFGTQLCGGKVNSHNDHRIAMSAAVASLICSGDVTITDALATNKSYPTFWQELERITMQKI